LPLYEYRCKQCGHQFEKIQSFSAPEEKECPVCHGEVERLISAPAIQFKGAGWYVNDYAGKSKAKSGSSAGDSSTGAEKTSGTAASSDGASKPSSDSASSGTSSSGSSSGAGAGGAGTATSAGKSD
jgi:putative FmdB family regulatory protein